MALHAAWVTRPSGVPTHRIPRRVLRVVPGALPGSGQPGGGQLIVELASTGQVDPLRRLLDESYAGDIASLDASTRAIRTAQVRTAAQRAAHHGQAGTLRLLVERGADLGLGLGNGRAIACEAASRGHADVLRILLLDAGASTEVQNGYGRTVSHGGCQERSRGVRGGGLRGGRRPRLRPKTQTVRRRCSRRRKDTPNASISFELRAQDLTVARTQDGKSRHAVAPRGGRQADGEGAAGGEGAK